MGSARLTSIVIEHCGTFCLGTTAECVYGGSQTYMVRSVESAEWDCVVLGDRRECTMPGNFS